MGVRSLFWGCVGCDRFWDVGVRSIIGGVWGCDRLLGVWGCDRLLGVFGGAIAVLGMCRMRSLFWGCVGCDRCLGLWDVIAVREFGGAIAFGMLGVR